MGKRKVTDKDIRSIEFAIDSVFPGASEKLLSKLSMFWLNGQRDREAPKRFELSAPRIQYA